MLPVVFEEAMHELMEAAEAGARDDLTELGEFLPLLLEDDVEGIKDSLARNGRDSQGLMLLWACLEGANTCAKYLIKNGALNDVERMELGEPLSAYTPITIAALFSDWGIVEALTEAGAEAHAFDKKGFSALAVAAFKYPHSNLASLLRLEETRRHINTPNSEGYTPLLMGSPSAVPLLVMAGADVNLAIAPVGTALHRACVEACLPLIEALVECGADERHKGIDGRTPLMIAVDQGDTDIVDYWLGRPGVDIGAKTEEGDTVVVTACRKGHVEVLKRLVAAGGRVNSETLYEPGPLVAGVFGGHIEVIKYLVEEAGADIDDVTLGKDVPPPFGLTACDFAAASGQWDALLCLVDLGADLSRCSVKLTFDAVRSKDEGLVARLLDADLSIDSRGADGATPLHTASCLHLPMVQLLVRRGADIEARDNKRRTPLMCAAQAGKVDVVTWLVEAGADPMAEDAAGFTASNLANCTHNKEIADYLWSVAAQRQHKVSVAVL
jgi:ankyrin repeat protein